MTDGSIHLTFTFKDEQGRLFDRVESCADEDGVRGAVDMYEHGNYSCDCNP